ncbi:MAG: arginyltransferase [Planctomycetes bacterium]|nr:arginyltransferase [Planctomycetota bacterium]MBI3834682.1 arginyltransferase [Planctomycetota bacterium]
MIDDALTSDDMISSPQAELDTLRNVSPESPCSYLPGRMARSEVYRTDRLDNATYEKLLARNFRRSGQVVYRPRCRGCHECKQARVSVAEFMPSRSMRRVWRRNSDVVVMTGKPRVNDEKHALFRRYLDGKHDESMSREFEPFREFLYDSPTVTQEICYRIEDRLAGVSIVDHCPNGLSSVYMFFDPMLTSRSLGTFSVLWEIAYCRKLRLPYYYLGFYVAGSRTMAYKARFTPCELLVADERWVTLRH